MKFKKEQEKVCKKCERERIYTCKGCSEDVGLSLSTLETALLAIDWSEERVFGSISKGCLKKAKEEIIKVILFASNVTIKPIFSGKVMDLLDIVCMTTAESEASAIDLMLKRNVPKWKIDLMLKFPLIRKIPAFKYTIHEWHPYSTLGKKATALIYRGKIIDQVPTNLE